MIGEVFGNYEVVAPLGQGGMGAVFLAEHRRIARRAAIKVLAPELTSDPDALRRFFNEARAASLINHPGIVEVFDCDVDAAGRAYIVMEYLEGETLAARLARSGPLPVDDACLLARKIAEAVGGAHEAGIVHRDLKPDNVHLLAPQAAAPEGNGHSRPVEQVAIKVLDFGVAKLLAAEARAGSMTHAGSLLGTPTYMSPEQCRGDLQVDQRTDVYALGCMLFEMICGRPPFTEEAIRVLLAAHTSRPPPLTSELLPDVPGWLDRLIARMLAKDPNDRPGSMQEVARALEIADYPDLPTVASPVGWIAPPEVRPTMASVRTRRRLIVSAWGALATALVLWALVLVEVKRQDEPIPPAGGGGLVKRAEAQEMPPLSADTVAVDKAPVAFPASLSEAGASTVDEPLLSEGARPDLGVDTETAGRRADMSARPPSAITRRHTEARLVSVPVQGAATRPVDTTKPVKVKVRTKGTAEATTDGIVDL